MLRSIKYPLIAVAVAVISLFAGAAMLIQFEQESSALTTEIITTINQQSPYKLQVQSAPTISIFPWLGIETHDVSLTNQHTSTPITAQQVSIKFNPFSWLTGQARISAIRLTGLNMDADAIPTLLHDLQAVQFPHIHPTDTVDIEIQQATLHPPANHPYLQHPIEKLHARIIGFSLYKPYTINASGDIDLLGQVNSFQVKTLADINDQSATLRNTHLKVLRPTAHGRLRLVADSNIEYAFRSKQLHLNDLIGFLNNAEFIGKLDIDGEKQQTQGNLHFLMFSLKNFAHALDKSVKISDKSGSYNTKAEMDFQPQSITIKADIDKQPVDIVVDRTQTDKPVAIHMHSMKLTYEDIDLFNALNSSHLLAPFNSQIEVDNLLWNNLKLSKGQISITQRPHVTDMTTQFNNFYRGTLTNTIHLYNDHASMQTHIKHGQVTPLLTDLGVTPEPASGTIELTSESNSEGMSYSELLNNAHSRMLIKLHNGHLSSNVNPTTIIMQYLSASNIQTTRPTLFQDIEAHCTMTPDEVSCNPIHISTRNSKMQGYLDLLRPTYSLQARMWLNAIKESTTIPLSVNYRGTLQNIRTEIDVKNSTSSHAEQTHHILEHYA